MPQRITGTYRAGHVELDEKVDWPEGTPVSVSDYDPGDELLKEEDWPDTPENRAEMLRRFDAMEPVMTPEEEAEFKAILAESKRFNKEAVRKQMGLDL